MSWQYTPELARGHHTVLITGAGLAPLGVIGS
jgi:hypothetical protein